jgi:hypothetical protein
MSVDPTVVAVALTGNLVVFDHSYRQDREIPQVRVRMHCEACNGVTELRCIQIWDSSGSTDHREDMRECLDGSVQECYRCKRKLFLKFEKE